MDQEKIENIGRILENPKFWRMIQRINEKPELMNIVIRSDENGNNEAGCRKVS